MSSLNLLSRRPLFWSLVALLLVAALLPWWRNHDYLRDFYDYGMFVSVNARLDAGQRPWVDFTTPAQSATFLLDYAAEHLGGGTFVGMTRGAAALIVVMLLTLAVMLARRWPPVVAALLAAAIVFCSASQHTIIFYNPLGVFALALVTWSCAIAPVWRREDRGWHALAAAGLVLGGTNKINFHLLACAIALGWALFAWVRGRASFRQVLGSAALIAGAGVVLPVAFELAWSGADLRTWLYNIVELPLSARGGRASALSELRTYLSTVHNYYGELRVPQAGLVVLVLPWCVVAATWRALHGPRLGWQRLFLVGAALMAGFGGAALLLTNNEIAYLTFAATLVMLVSLWLGFGAAVPSRWFVGALALPALLLGAAGWESAWHGQRSQFGHAQTPRSDYVRGETIDPEMGYLRGLAVPPNLAQSLGDLAGIRRGLGAPARDQVFYGPGLEWLQRVWPSHLVSGLPLIVAGFNNPRESEAVRRLLIDNPQYAFAVVLEAWDVWRDRAISVFPRRCMKQRVGGVIFLYVKLPGDVLTSLPLDYSPTIAGNVDASRIGTNLEFAQLDAGHSFVGVSRGSGYLRANANIYRISATAVLKRAAGATGPLRARFAAAAVNGAARYPRWQQEIVLPAEQDSATLATPSLDGSGLPVEFTVEVAPESAGVGVAGWRAPVISNCADYALPPQLQQGVLPLSSGDPDYAAVLLPPNLQSAAVQLRDSYLRDGRTLLPPGGEVWIKLSGAFSRLEVEAQALPGGELPKVRVYYYKGGRLEPFHPEIDAKNKSIRVNAWSPEMDGWIGILNDPDRSSPAAQVRVISAEKANR